MRIAEKDLTSKIINFLSSFAEYPEVYPVLKRALGHADPSLRKAAVRAIQYLSRKGQTDATVFLLDYCSHDMTKETIILVDALAKTGSPQAVPVLLNLLDRSRGKSDKWLEWVLSALGQTGDRRSVEPVLKWLLEQSDGSRHAANALPKLAGAAAVQPRLLRALVEEPDQNIRSQLRKTIEKIAGDALPAELVRVLPNAHAGDKRCEGPQKDVLLS